MENLASDLIRLRGEMLALSIRNEEMRERLEMLELRIQRLHRMGDSLATRVDESAAVLARLEHKYSH